MGNIKISKATFAAGDTKRFTPKKGETQMAADSKEECAGFLYEMRNVIVNALKVSANQSLSEEIHHMGLAATLEDLQRGVEKKLMELHEDSI